VLRIMPQINVLINEISSVLTFVRQTFTFTFMFRVLPLASPPPFVVSRFLL
jgi:hypothetical protein